MNKIEKVLATGILVGLGLTIISNDSYLQGFGRGMASMAAADAIAYEAYELYCGITSKYNIFDNQNNCEGRIK